MSIRISELEAAVSVNDTDIIPIVQNGTTKKADVSLIRPASGVAAGTYGAAGQIPQLTVDTKGRITSATTVSISPLSNPTINGYVEGNTNLGIVGASKTLDISSSTVLIATLTAATATTFTMPPTAPGKAFTLYLKQPASGTVGSATFTNVKWQNNTAPVITQFNGTLDILPFVSDGVNWYGSSVQNFVY
jgi:hypothetical protein